MSNSKFFVEYSHRSLAISPRKTGLHFEQNNCASCFLFKLLLFIIIIFKELHSVSCRYLYWGQGGQTPCIFRAGLDGSNRQCISRQYVEHPNGMTLGMRCHSHAHINAVMIFQL